MKTITKTQCHCHRCEHAARGQCSKPQPEDQVCLLINAACAARGGLAQMTLNDWRELEREARERLQNECA